MTDPGNGYCDGAVNDAAVDSQLPTCELMSDGEIAQLLDKLFINCGEIVAMMSNAGAGSEGEEEGGSQPDAVTETTEPARITSTNPESGSGIRQTTSGNIRYPESGKFDIRYSPS